MSQSSQSLSEEWGQNQMDYLTPEQRLNAVVEILATIALRAVNQRESNQDDEHQDS